MRPHAYRIVRRIKQTTNTEHLELRLANSRSLQCSFSRVPLIPSLHPKRRGPNQPIFPKPPADNAYLGRWISTLITDNTGSLQCTICWAWWQHWDLISTALPAQASKSPEAQRRAPWAPVSRFSFLRVNWRSRSVLPQLNSTLDGVGGSQNSW